MSSSRDHARSSGSALESAPASAVVTYEGFVEELEPRAVFARLYTPIGEELSVEIPRDHFPAEPALARGVIFYMDVPQDGGRATFRFPPPWTQEELDEARAKGRQMALDLARLFDDDSSAELNADKAPGMNP